MAFETTRQEILKQAIELKKLYDSTRIQKYKDEELRLRRIVAELSTLILGASNLNGLTDVTLTSPTNSQVLAYNSSSGQWVNQTAGGDMLKSVYDVDNDGVVDGAETIQIIVRNSTGSTLTKGQVVYLSGATGNRPNALLSRADTEATATKTIGIVVANISNNSDGYVAVNGTLHDLDTSAFTAGDAVWLSATTAGGMTSTIPAEPNYIVFIGYIARSHPTQGRLVIEIQSGYELNELHGVLIASEANNDLLVYETSTTLWKNKSISTIFGGTPLVSVPTLAQVTTAGNTTTNAITVAKITTNGSITAASLLAQGAYFNNTLVAAANNDVLVGLDINPTFTNGAFTGVSNVALRTQTGNVIFGSTSGNVGIGTTTPTAKLEVSGNIKLSSTGQQLQDFNGNNLIRNSAGTLTVGNAAVNINMSLTVGTGGATVNIPNGNVLIGTTTDAGYKLDVNGTARVQGAFSATLANVSTANVVYYNSSTGLMTYGAAPAIPSGFTGMFTVPTNPPGQQTLVITNGIITNVM